MTGSATFTAAVHLTPCEPEHADLAFTATTQDCPWPKAYGGDLVAQAAAAAMRSVTDGKTLHSTHSYFLRPADIGAEVRYEVELLRDGRGYATRGVRGYQRGKPVYVSLANFAAGETGGTFEAPFLVGFLVFLLLFCFVFFFVFFFCCLFSVFFFFTKDELYLLA